VLGVCSEPWAIARVPIDRLSIRVKNEAFMGCLLR
jgi:hypothetical protein